MLDIRSVAAPVVLLQFPELGLGAEGEVAVPGTGFRRGDHRRQRKAQWGRYWDRTQK